LPSIDDPRDHPSVTFDEEESYPESGGQPRDFSCLALRLRFNQAVCFVYARWFPKAQDQGSRPKSCAFRLWLVPPGVLPLHRLASWRAAAAVSARRPVERVHAGVTENENVRTRSGVLFAPREQAANEVDQAARIVPVRVLIRDVVGHTDAHECWRRGDRAQQVP
jgi:hypothetical protein